MVSIFYTTHYCFTVKVFNMNEHTTQSTNETKLASFGLRLGSYIIDQVVLVFIGLIFGSIIGIISAIVNVDLSLIVVLVGVILAILYGLLDAHSGTVGKMILGLKVINESNQKIDLNTAILRSLCKGLIPFNAFISLVTILQNEDKKSLHDIIMKTRVVKK